MHFLSAWFTRNPVAANLLMILILIAGYFTMTSIRIEGFPALPASSVTIYTVYPGAGADQVDAGISRRIELALEGMPGIKKLSALSFEGFSRVVVQKVSRFDLDRFQNDIKTRVDAIDDFPQKAERPTISRDEFNVEALLVQVFGETDTRALQKTARTVKQALVADPGIAKIEMFGLTPYEIRIEADEQTLAAHKLTFEDLVRAVQTHSFDFTTGTLKSASGKITLKADTRAFDLAAFKKIPVTSRPDGASLELGDVAHVIDGFADDDSFARFQGKPSVGMLIYTTKRGDLIQVSRAARKIVNRLEKEIPHHIHVDIWGESSIYMKARLNLLKSNAVQGLMIVFGLLALFLNLRLAFWVAMGIPISIGGAMVLMGPRFLDYSLNDVTTFGLIIVLGILVDDAVVVGESVFEERQKISDPIQGTVAGVSKVSTATVFGCFTTIAAFYPPLLINNDLGRIFAGFSMVVIISLLVSLVESKLILPAHLADIKIHRKQTDSRLQKAWVKVQSAAQNTLLAARDKGYTPLLKTALHHRYSFFLGFILLSSIVIGLATKGIVKTVFFPEVPGQIINVNMDMINGSPLDLTVKNMERLEQAAEELNAEVMARTNTDQPPIVHLLSALSDKESVAIYAELQPEKIRKIDTLETLKRWREKVKDLEGIHKLTFTGSFETAGGFEFQIGAADTSVLKPASDEIVRRLKHFKGVSGVYSDLEHGTPMIRLTLKPSARHLGLSAVDLARFIGNSFGGLEVQRFLKQTEEVKVVVKYKEEKRRYISDLLASRIQLPSGVNVPLTQVADLQTGHMPAGVFRKNGQRVVTVEADCDKKITSPSEVFDRIKKEIEPVLQHRYPGLSLRGAGELEEIGEMQGGLKKAFIMILIGIFALIAIPLKSYLQPLVIMSVIPFAFVGAVLGHCVLSLPLSILSFLGVLGACGVVVNDSLVMLTRFNDLRMQGIPFKEALVRAGTSRFRAIFLTTTTTVGGLAPLMFESSEQAQYLIPAAVSLAFGELVATPFTLLLIPMLLSMGNDIQKRCAFLISKRNVPAMNGK